MTPRPEPSREAAAPLLAVTVVLWGTQFVAIDAAAAHAPPVMITALRATLGAVALRALLPLLRARLPSERKMWFWALLTGVLMVVLIFEGISEGTVRAGAANASVLANTSPFFVLVLGRIFLGERMAASGIVGLVLGFAGVVLMVLSQLGASGETANFALGVALALAGAAGWGIGTLMVKRIEEREQGFDVVGFTAAQYLVGAPVLLVIGFATGAVRETDWAAGALWGPIAYIAIGSSALASVTFFSALRRTAAGRAASWQFLVPVVAVGVEVLRGDAPDGTVLAGMALATAGVALANLAPMHSPSQTVAPTRRG